MDILAGPTPALSQSGHPKPIRMPQANQDRPCSLHHFPLALWAVPSSSGSCLLFFSFIVYSPHLPASAPVSGAYTLCLELYPKASLHQGTKSHLLSLRQKPQGNSMTCSRDKGLRGGTPSERPSGRAGPARGVDSSPRPLHNAYQGRKAEGRLLPGINGRAHALLHPILGLSSRIQRDK